MRRRIAALAAITIALAGCSTPQPSPTPEPSTDLVAARIAAGLPACPDTDPAAAAVPGGLPQTTLECLGGTNAVNLAGLPRRPMVVNLWAQWCGPCREESGHLARVWAAKADKVSFVGIDYLDPQPALAIEFASLVGWTYPHVYDPERSLQGPLAVPGIPMTLFVNDAGVIVHRHAGPLTSDEQLSDLIATHLGVS